MNITRIPWYIPSHNEKDEHVAEDLRKLGFTVLCYPGPRLEVTPPPGWTGEITKQEAGVTLATIFDDNGNPRLECYEDIDDDEYSPDPADIMSTKVLG